MNNQYQYYYFCTDPYVKVVDLATEVKNGVTERSARLTINVPEDLVAAKSSTFIGLKIF